MKILVIGTGAIGSFYGSLLAKAGAEVAVVARSDYDHVREHGIDIRSDTLGDWHFKPAAMYRTAAEVADKPDYVLLCIKMLEGIDQASLVRDALGPNTSIVLIANGLDVEVELAAVFQHHELISGVTYIRVTRMAPGKIWHQGEGKIVLGTYPHGVSTKTQKLVDIYAATPVKGAATENIVKDRWAKTVWNAAFNPISVLSGGLTVSDILKTSESLVRGVMNDVCRVAAAVGHKLPDDWVDNRIAFSYGMAPYKTSMLVDFEAGRPMETEAILGAAVRAANRLHIDAPHIETLYALLRMRALSVAPS